MGETKHRDVALGAAAGGVRAAVAVGRFALLPLRVLSRAPGVHALVGRTEERLAADGAALRARGRSEVESAADELAHSREVEEAAERFVEQLTSTPEFRDALDRAVQSSAFQSALEEAAASGAVRAALMRQTTTLADEMVSAARARAAELDDTLQRSLSREPAAAYGGLVARSAAFAIDLTVTLVAFLTGAALVGLAASLARDVPPGWVVGLLAGVWWTLAAGTYFVVFWTLAGQTPGLRLLGLRVVGPGGRPPGLGRASVRFVGLLLAIAPLFAGFVPVLFDRRRRGLHDYLAGTVVAPEGEPVLEASSPRVAHDAANAAARRS